MMKASLATLPSAAVAAALLCCVTTAAAQIEVVGITRATPTVVRQQFPQCQYQRCVPPGFEQQVGPHAGGTAYDSRIQGVWVTNGLLLANVDPWNGNCDYICKPQKMPLPPVPGVRHYATGLAYCDSGPLTTSVGPGWLFASYNSGYLARIDVKHCAVSAKFCRPSLPAGAVISALASDDINRRLFVGIVLPNGGNLVYVSNLDKDWCQFLCKTQLPACDPTQALGPLTGLAFDPCRQMLFATDGLLTQRFAVDKPPQCQVKSVDCCRRSGDPFTGLCLLPQRNLKDVGKSCTTRACESCPTMRAEVAGDPVLGNPFFGLRLADAPNKSSTAVLAAGIGACSPIGVNIGFCERLRVPLPPILLFYGLSPIAVNGCSRSVTLPWQVPLNQGLCGLKVAFQWLVVCKGVPTGHGVTNCSEFTFSGT